MKSFIFAAIAALSLVPPAWSGSPVVVARGDKSAAPRQPQVAVDDAGVIHVAFGVNDSVRYCRSEDRGASFSAPVELPSLGVLSLEMRRGPRIAAIDGSILISAIGGAKGKGQDGDLLAFRSADAGATWAGPVRVNDVADSAREGLHAMAAGPGGQVGCVWLDLRHQKTEVMASVSTDGGATWSKNVLVYRSPDGSVCQCCHPSVAFGPDGAMHVLWRNSLDGNRDMYLATSTDGGATFGQAVKLGKGTWPLDACPMDGGAIACSPTGDVHTVWRREGHVFAAALDDPQERDLGDGEQPWLAATSEGVYTVWLRKRGAPALLLRPNAVAPTQLAATAYDPVVAASPKAGGQVVVAWEGRDAAGVYVIVCEVVE